MQLPVDKGNDSNNLLTQEVPPEEVLPTQKQLRDHYIRDPCSMTFLTIMLRESNEKENSGAHTAGIIAHPIYFFLPRMAAELWMSITFGSGQTLLQCLSTKKAFIGYVLKILYSNILRRSTGDDIPQLYIPFRVFSKERNTH